MHRTDLDPSSLRDWMAAVGLLRLASETTSTGRGHWAVISNRYRFVVEEVPAEFPALCSRWIAEHRDAFDFGGAKNVDFDGAFWRKHAAEARGISAELWAAVASDGVWHYSGKKLQASGLEYGHGGGHQDWLASMRGFIERGVSPEAMSALLRGERDEGMAKGICRWDPRCERDHAYRAKAPTADAMTQDQTINALAAIGLASCPSAPRRSGLATPITDRRGALSWPVWTEPIRLTELEAALCCGWSWPTVHSERLISDRLYRFRAGGLREP
jgi:hypothetical protein